MNWYKYSAKTHILLILLGFLLSALMGYGHFIDGDVIQILDKAHKLVTEGVLVPYGNGSTSGASGKTPGAFLSLATGGPMLVWFSPWSMLAFLALLHLVAYGLYRSVLKDFINPAHLLLITVFFWINPWRLSEIFIWNPSYIYLASCLHFWTAYKLSQRASFTMSVLHGLSIFLALQIHMSFMILVFMTLFLLWTRAMKPNWSGAFVSIVLGLLSLTPYFLAGLNDPSLFPQPGADDGKGFLFFGLLRVYPLLKGFWYWILFGSNIFQTHAFHQVHFLWMGEGTAAEFTKYAWTGFKYLMGALGVLLSFHVNFKFYGSHKASLAVWHRNIFHENNWLPIYVGSAFVSAMIATAIAPTTVIYWHLLMIWPFTLIPLILFLDQKLNAYSSQASRYLSAVLIYFILTNVVVGLGSKKHDIRQSFHELYFKACKETCSMKNLEEADQDSK